MLKKIKSLFVLDLRSLALFRVFLGSVLFIDVLIRLPLIDDFYIDSGVLPRAALIEKFANKWTLSVHFMSGEYPIILALFLAAAVLNLMLMFGYKTRLATIGSWLCFSSMMVRNPMVSYGGDDILKLALFWSMFLPLSAVWSVDACRSGEKIKFFEHLSIPSAALLLQIFCTYFFTGLLKWHPVWYDEGSALYYVFELEMFTTQFAALVKNFPEIIYIFLTKSTLLLELLGPFFLFMPWFKGRLRDGLVFVFISFHLGIDLLMHLGLFPAICISLWIVVLTRNFWESEIGVRLAKILDNFWRRMTAFIHVDKTGLVHSLSAPVGKGWQFFSLFCLFIAIIWNVASYGGSSGVNDLSPIKEVGYVMGLNQRWNMFAPYPTRDDGWYVVDGLLKNGQSWDVFYNQPVDYTKPASVADRFINNTWRKYLVNLWSKKFSAHRLYFGRYLCRKFNKDKPDEEKVDTFTINFMLEKTPPPGEPVGEAVKNTIWTHWCFKKP